MNKIIESIIKNDPFMITLTIYDNDFSITQDIFNESKATSRTNVYNNRKFNNSIIEKLLNYNYITISIEDYYNRKCYTFLQKNKLEENIDLDGSTYSADKFVLRFKNGDSINIRLDSECYNEIVSSISHVLTKILARKYSERKKEREELQNMLHYLDEEVNGIQDIVNTFSKEDQLRFEFLKDK